jgi:hypothetical protein
MNNEAGERLAQISSRETRRLEGRILAPEKPRNF